MALPGGRRWGRPKRKWIDCTYSDMREQGVSRKDVQNRTLWREQSAVATPDKENSRKKKKTAY